MEASKAPLVTLHFVSAGLYFGSTVLWLAKIVKRHHHFLKIQHFVSSLGLLMAFEQLMTGIYYLPAQHNGEILGFLWVVAVVDASQFVFRLIFLLLLSLGYSLVWEIIGMRSLLYWSPLGADTFTTSLFYLVTIHVMVRRFSYSV